MNAFIMYDRIYNEEAAKKKEGMPRKLNHLELLRELIFDLMGWQLDDAELVNDDDAPVLSNTWSTSASDEFNSCIYYRFKFYVQLIHHERTRGIL